MDIKELEKTLAREAKESEEGMVSALDFYIKQCKRKIESANSSMQWAAENYFEAKRELQHWERNLQELTELQTAFSAKKPLANKDVSIVHKYDPKKIRDAPSLPPEAFAKIEHFNPKKAIKIIGDTSAHGYTINSIQYAFAQEENGNVRIQTGNTCDFKTVFFGDFVIVPQEKESVLPQYSDTR